MLCLSLQYNFTLPAEEYVAKTIWQLEEERERLNLIMHEYEYIWFATPIYGEKNLFL